jgi:hypothetical protein
VTENDRQRTDGDIADETGHTDDQQQLPARIL